MKEEELRLLELIKLGEIHLISEFSALLKRRGYSSLDIIRELTLHYDSCGNEEDRTTLKYVVSTIKIRDFEADLSE
jgi:hypothetical protein